MARRGFYISEEFFEAACKLPKAQRDKAIAALVCLYFNGETDERLPMNAQVVVDAFRGRAEHARERNGLDGTGAENVRDASGNGSKTEQNLSKNSTKIGQNLSENREEIEQESRGFVEKPFEKSSQKTDETAGKPANEGGQFVESLSPIYKNNILIEDNAALYKKQTRREDTTSSNDGGDVARFMAGCLEAWNEAGFGPLILEFPGEARQGLVAAFNRGRTIEDVRRAIRIIKTSWSPEYRTPNAAFKDDRIENLLARPEPESRDYSHLYHERGQDDPLEDLIV